jgi:hypothetical protein
MRWLHWGLCMSSSRRRRTQKAGADVRVVGEANHACPSTTHMDTPVIMPLTRLYDRICFFDLRKTVKKCISFSTLEEVNRFMVQNGAPKSSKGW